MKSISRILKAIKNIEVKEEISLRDYSYLGLAAIGTLIIVRDRNQLPEVLSELKKNQVEFEILGKGSNTVLKNKKIYLQLAEQLSEDYWEKIHEEYRLPAGTAIAKLTAHAAKFGLVGFEVFTGVPATIAGAVVMNAGTGLGEVGQIVKEVSLVSKDGIFRTHKIKEGDFSYRQNHFIHPGEIITEVVLRPISINENIKKQIKDYLEMRNRTQPMKEKTCGCVFKNYSTDLRAGKLIDKLGLKGLNLFGFKISHTHANFVENHGDEGAEKFIEFISMIRDEIELFYGIKLEYEVLI